jgi:hypothetical protein
MSLEHAQKDATAAYDATILLKVNVLGAAMARRKLTFAKIAKPETIAASVRESKRGSFQ